MYANLQYGILNFLKTKCQSQMGPNASIRKKPLNVTGFFSMRLPRYNARKDASSNSVHMNQTAGPPACSLYSSRTIKKLNTPTVSNTA